jgi:surfactin synthase thioesterase subunit
MAPAESNEVCCFESGSRGVVMDSTAARWLRGRDGRSGHGALAAPRVRLLCFPYAGAGASMYHGWYSNLPGDVDVRAVQLPGRQDRLGEKRLSRVADMVERVELALGTLPELPLVLFGHSFGGILAFELARRLELQGQHILALIVSAARGPGYAAHGEPIHDRADEAFLQAIHERYATPWAILGDRELMALTLPCLRSDVEALETYVHDAQVAVRAPITILRGLRDAQMGDKDVTAWRQATRGATFVHEVDAGHFFIDSHAHWVIERVRAALDASSSSLRKINAG